MKSKRRNGCLMPILLIVLGIFCTVVIIATTYQIDRDINGWKEIAQISSEPNDMLLYMSNVKSGMEKWGMTKGYAAVLFKTPGNDMSLIYRAVTQHVEQAKVLTTMDRTSAAYQTGLDYLQDSITKMDLMSHYYWLIHKGLIWVIGALVGFGLGFPLGNEALKLTK